MYDDVLAPKGESNYLPFDSGMSSGGKLCTHVVLLMLVYRGHVSQKEKVSKQHQIDLFVIFSSTQHIGA